MASSLWSDFGELVSLLDDVLKIPQERWNERDPFNRTLLNMACKSRQLAAVRILYEYGLPIEDDDMDCAIESNSEEIVAYLHSRGARIFRRHLGLAIRFDSWNCARFLISNGIRFMKMGYHHFMPLYSHFCKLEQCYRNCRKSVIVLIGMKRKGTLIRWDRFLLRHLAICVWTTRADGKWIQENLSNEAR